MQALIINGPNLNLLGQRESQTYGSTTLTEIISSLESLALELDVQLCHVQSNAEHELIEAIHAAGKQGVDYIIINPAAFTHTSIGLRDALLAVEIPFIELHISNVHARESFRHKSYFSDIAMGVIVGLGARGYEVALRALASIHAENR